MVGYLYEVIQLVGVEFLSTGTGPFEFKDIQEIKNSKMGLFNDDKVYPDFDHVTAF